MAPLPLDYGSPALRLTEPRTNNPSSKELIVALRKTGIDCFISHCGALPLFVAAKTRQSVRMRIPLV
jgi:hypothetical protein